MSTTTPMLQQYLEIKHKHQDAILFFRMGDFYEMFFEDAQIASRELDIALTSRNKSKADGVPLCGVPCLSAPSYISRLVNKGYKVAICEQIEEEYKGRQLLPREVVKVVTPGLVLEDEALNARENNYLITICQRGGRYGMAILELSTGDFRITELDSRGELLEEIDRLTPREIILADTPRELKTLGPLISRNSACPVNFLPAHHFEPPPEESLTPQALPFSEGLRAAGATLYYLRETQKMEGAHLKEITPYRIEEHLIIDETTRRSLELTENLDNHSRQGTLLALLDECSTSMGGRLLKHWLLYPLREHSTIQLRLEAVEELKQEKILREELRTLLREIHDLERLSSRIVMLSAHARDLLNLSCSLAFIPQIRGLLKGTRSKLLSSLTEGLDELSDVHQGIEQTLLKSPPLSLKEGGLIRDGYHPELDQLRALSREGQGGIGGLESRERKRTGIPTLRIRFNKVFGFFIEVTRSYLKLVPPDYIRKQTTVGAERFITEELKNYEEKVLSAQQRAWELEYELFKRLRQDIARHSHRILRSARVLAQLDVLSSLSRVADLYNYVRPRITQEDRIEILEGRHPVVEHSPPFNPLEANANLAGLPAPQSGGRGRFIPNDIYLDNGEHRLLIITGPNMAGKSTIIRQVALIVLMAQMGSFVPARDATISLVDRIFTRVGASDRLYRGQSTFMVEMAEMANILSRATPRSLLIIDEIGRGTSTFDGLAIAWAVAEYILRVVGAKTLFATHYHELTELAHTHPNVKNYNVIIKEWNEEIIFLHKLMEGSTSRSYGVQVARLAGLPPETIARARELLSELQKGEFRLKNASPAQQLPLFPAGDEKLRRELSSLDVDRLTPLEALNKLAELKKLAKENRSHDECSK